MNNKLINIGGHGLGDCLLSLQISFLLKSKNIDHINLISTRTEIFKILDYLYSDFLPKLENIDASLTDNEAIEKNQEILNYIIDKYKSKNITYNIPNLLFNNKLAFDANSFNLNTGIIKQTRTLINKKQKNKDIIYCALSSNTTGYLYRDIPLLIKKIAMLLPSYTIYFPYITHWVKDISYNGDFNNMPNNVWIDKDPDFQQSIEILSTSNYCVSTCNGPSHLAYHFGIPRLVLDPMFKRVPWMSRWKEDYSDCIDINSNENLIAQIIYHNIKYPYTSMIDRKILADQLSTGYNKWPELFLCESET
jgi:hypothetical protein